MPMATWKQAEMVPPPKRSSPRSRRHAGASAKLPTALELRRLESAKRFRNPAWFRREPVLGVSGTEPSLQCAGIRRNGCGLLRLAWTSSSLLALGRNVVDATRLGQAKYF